MSQPVCPNCQSANDADAAFCGNCGSPMQPATPPATAAFAPPAGYSGPVPTQPPAHPYGQSGYQQAPYGQVPYDQAQYGHTPYGQAPYAQDPYAHHPYAQPTFVLVGFGPRLLAYLIDGVVLGVLYWVTGIPAGSTLAMILSAIYFIASWGIKGQTVGKMALGLKVVSEDGSPLDWGKATIRYFGQLLSAAILCIGFIMIAFDSQKRGLHDMIAKTRVVSSR